MMMNRRALMQRIAAVASAVVWSGDTLAVELAKAATARENSATAAPEKVVPLNATQQATLEALCECVIPATETPGAVAAGVPAFVQDMFREWMTDAERELFRAGLDAADAAARAAHGRGLAQCTAAQQAALLAGLRADLAAYKPPGFDLASRLADPKAPFFHKLRDLTTLGYFTSEAGISAELAYVPVPGRFEGDVPLAQWQRQMQL